MDAIKLPFVTTGFNVCYEAEIPECAASLTEQGAELILCPSATFTERGFWRVRHCANARCIENQVYMIHCGLTGVENIAPLPSCWSASAVLSPCDTPWQNANGVLAQAKTNCDDVIKAELDLTLLRQNRLDGAATTFKDRRRQAHLYNKWQSHIHRN